MQHHAVFCRIHTPGSALLPQPQPRIHALQLTSALEVPFPPFLRCHTEQSCSQRATKSSSLIWRETIQRMVFWEESRGGKIFLDLCVVLTCIVAADLPCSIQDNGWKWWLGEGECPSRDHLHLNVELYVKFFVAAPVSATIPSQFTRMVCNLPTVQRSCRDMCKVGWGPNNNCTKLLANPSSCSVPGR